MGIRRKQILANNTISIPESYGNETAEVNTLYDQVEDIFRNLLNINFPKIQEVAKVEADKRIDLFLDSLKISLKEHKNDIDFNKFIDPGIQFEMSEVIKSVACNKKSNIQLISEVFCVVLSKNIEDVIELIAGEALAIIPRIYVKHLSLLSLQIFTFDIDLDNTSLLKVNEEIDSIMHILDPINNITSTDIAYLCSINCIESRAVVLLDHNPVFIDDMNTKSIDIMAEARRYECFNIIRFYELMRKCHTERYRLTPIGKLIGSLYIKDFVKVDINDLF